MKALIIFASPHRQGSTAALVDVFKENFKGEVEQIDLFPNLSKGILPCIDCGSCKRKMGCVINDDFEKATRDDYDVLVIASPIYMSNLPPPLWNLISRFNFTFGNRVYLKQTRHFKEKGGVLILTGGGTECKKLMGKTNEDEAIKEANYIFAKVNARLDHVFLSLNTDTLPAEKDENVKEKIALAARELSCQQDKH